MTWYWQNIIKIVYYLLLKSLDLILAEYSENSLLLFVKVTQLDIDRYSQNCLLLIIKVAWTWYW